MKINLRKKEETTLLGKAHEFSYAYNFFLI